jgi:hypothetical protein
MKEEARVRKYHINMDYATFITLSTAISLTAIVLVLVAVFYPKIEPIDLMIQGIILNRYPDMQEESKTAHLQIQGELITRFKGEKTYRGYLKVLEGIDDPRITVMNQAETIIEFREEKGILTGSIIYPNPPKL